MKNIGNVRVGKTQSVVDALPEQEHPIAVVPASRWQTDTHFLGSPTITLTTEPLLVVKEKLFGQAKINDEVLLLSIDSTGSAPVNSIGSWALKITTRAGEQYGIYFPDAHHGQEFEDELRRVGDAVQQKALEFLARLGTDAGASSYS